MVKIGWFSRHPFIPAQLDELKRLFGDDVQVRRYRGSLRTGGYKDADEIINICLREGIRYAVVVLPLSMIDQLKKQIEARNLDITLVRAEMEELQQPNEKFNPYNCVNVNGRLFKFVEFREILEVKLITRPLKP